MMAIRSSSDAARASGTRACLATRRPCP
jgi:hypothetical protein